METSSRLWARFIMHQSSPKAAAHDICKPYIAGPSQRHKQKDQLQEEANNKFFDGQTTHRNEQT